MQNEIEQLRAWKEVAQYACHRLNVVHSADAIPSIDAVADAISALTVSDSKQFVTGTKSPAAKVDRFSPMPDRLHQEKLTLQSKPGKPAHALEGSDPSIEQLPQA